MTTMTRRLLIAILCATALLEPGAASAQAGVTGQRESPIAIVVHPSSPLLDLSVEDLRRLFLGSTTSLENGERVELGGWTDSRARFYRSALGMSEDRLKRHWISRVFAGQPGTPPLEFRNADELLDFVASHPGAVAFVDAGAVRGEVKVITIDGRRPRDAGYAIR